MGTGVAYLFVPGERMLFPLSGRFADAALVQRVTGQPLEFFGSYVDVAFNIRVLRVAGRKGAKREYKQIQDAYGLAKSSKDPVPLTIRFLTQQPKEHKVRAAIQERDRMAAQGKTGNTQGTSSLASSFQVRRCTLLLRTTTRTALQRALAARAAKGPSRAARQAWASPTEAAGLYSCITYFHYSLPLRLPLRASSQQALRYFTVDCVGGPSGHSSRDSHARAAQPPVAPRAWAG